MPAPGVFVYAQVVNVQAFLVHQHRVVLGDFDDAEAVAQQLIPFHSGENGPIRVFQQFLQRFFIVFLRPGAEQVGADAVVNLSHLKQ